MKLRNFVPKQPVSTGPGAGIRREITLFGIASFVEDFASGVLTFLNAEHPRGPNPAGPEEVAATARADSIVVTWCKEATGAVIDNYVIYRADAGTSGAPTTPAFSAAIRIAVVPSGRVARQLPINSVCTYADLDFTSADRTDGRRFKYWVSALDNESVDGLPPRESRPVPAAAIATVPAPSVGAGGASSVEATIDFGAASDYVVTTVAAAWVAAGTEIVATMGDATADHDVEDGALEEIHLSVGNKVAGVSFDLHAYAPNGTFGQYKVNCIGV